MNELVEFIRGRLEEDAAEQHERYCSGGWHANSCALHYDDWPEGGPPQRRRPEKCDCGVPEQVLRAVETKQALLADCLQLAATPRQPSELEAGFSVLSPASLPHAMLAERFLRRLASEWDTHQDYSQVWAP